MLLCFRQCILQDAISLLLTEQTLRVVIVSFSIVALSVLVDNTYLMMMMMMTMMQIIGQPCCCVFGRLCSAQE